MICIGERFCKYAAVLLLVLLSAACSANTGNTEYHHIAVIASGESRLVKLDGLRDGLIQRGYDLVADISLTLYDAGNEGDRVAELITQALADEPDVLVTLGGIETQTARSLVDDTPIVFIGVADTLAWGVVESIQAPGTGITGIDNGYIELTGKRLEWTQRLLPEADHITVLYSEGIVPSEAARSAAQRTADLLDMNVSAFAINAVPHSESLLAALVELDTDALVILPSYLIENAFMDIVAAAQQADLPTIGLNTDATAQGAFASYGASFYDMGYQAARLVDKVLRGIPPESIPVEFPDQPELSVNLQTAAALNLHLSVELLALVQEVIRS
ncbi:MAG: ABC transporter substrate-binding protein [Chloroflexota bacterium]